MTNIIAVLIFCTLLTSSMAQAAALGLPENTAKIGYELGIGYVSVDNPKGSNNTTWHSLPLNIFYNDWLTSDIRYWAQAFYYQASMNARSNKIGLNLKHYGLRLSLQKSFRLAPLWAPWLGAGVDISQAEFSKRHLVDSDGYLVETFPDKNETLLALILNLSSEWPYRRNWVIGAKLEQSIPIQGSLTNLMATVSIGYRY